MKNIHTGLGQLEDVVGKRTRAIKKQLKDVEALPAAETKKILPDSVLESDNDETEE